MGRVRVSARGGRFRKGQSGNPRGRKRGVLNKATVDFRENADRFFSEDYWPRLSQRFQRGKVGEKEVIALLHLRYGKPKEQVELSNPDGTKLFGDVPDPKLAKLAVAAAEVLSRPKDGE